MEIKVEQKKGFTCVCFFDVASLNVHLHVKKNTLGINSTVNFEMDIVFKDFKYAL